MSSQLRSWIVPEGTVTRPVQQHVRALDGLRGLAVLLVLCYDCLKLPNDGSPLTLLVRKAASCGWIGVDLFFVLSGFLITGILVDTAGRRGYWKSFLIRRSLRIFPLYYATLLIVFVFAPLLAASWNWDRLSDSLAAVGSHQAWYWVYGQNWLYAIEATWPQERVLNHFWSLAIEEQFYLVWPLVVIGFHKSRLGAVCLSLALFALILRCWLLWEGTSGVATYVMTITRLDSLCAGGLLAVGMRSIAWRQRWLRWTPLVCAIAFIAIIAIDTMYPILASGSLGAYSVGHSLVALLFALLIATLLVLPDWHPVSRLFCFNGLVTLGKYSYAIYVFHRFVYYGLLELNWEPFPLQLRGWAIFGTTLLASYAVARVSWTVIEAPFLRLKKYAPRPDQESEITPAEAVHPVPREPSRSAPQPSLPH